MKKKTLLPVIKAGVSFVLACSLVASPGLSYAQTTNSMVVALEKTPTKPSRIAVTFNGDTKTQVGINWFTKERVDDAVVVVSTSKDFVDAKTYKPEIIEDENTFLQRDANGKTVFKNSKTGEEFRAEDRPLKWSAGKDELPLVKKVNEHRYSVIIDGLTAGTTYYYRVGRVCDADGQSERGTFKTGDSTAKPFTFVQYTDTQNAYWNEDRIDEAAYGADTLKRALEKYPDTGFALHTGDFVEVAEIEDEWVDLMDQSQASFLSTVLVPTSGNHDEYTYDSRDRKSATEVVTKFTDHFNVPFQKDGIMGGINGGTYYSYDYNGAHFIVLNTNDNNNAKNQAVSLEQREWMRKDVAKARENGANWINLSYHKPLFSKSYHSLQYTDVANVRQELMKLIDELGIDLALQGHDHVLSVTKNLKYGDSADHFANGQAVNTVKIEENGRTMTINPEGTKFMIPNTAGTKAYDNIFDKPLAHIKKVRPKLDWLTQSQLDAYNHLFEIGDQPQDAPEFADSHSNIRNNVIQTFAAFEVHPDKINIDINYVKGEIVNRDASKRTVESIATFGLDKSHKPLKAVENKKIERVSGSNRIETAVAVSKKAYDKADSVIVVNAMVYADSLIASSLSGMYDAPILLVNKDAIPQQVHAEIQRLGATKAILVGGTNVLSKTIESALQVKDIQRYAGSDRYETAKVVADAVAKKGEVKEVLIARGDNFPDALAVSAQAQRDVTPILLTPTASLHTTASTFLKANQVKNVTIAGGDAAVGVEAQNAIRGIADNVVRFPGADRYLTALGEAIHNFKGSKTVVIATGEDFPDALAGAALAGELDAPIVLNPKANLYDQVKRYIDDYGIEKVYILGGENAIANSVSDGLK